MVRRAAFLIMLVCCALLLGASSAVAGFDPPSGAEPGLPGSGPIFAPSGSDSEERESTIVPGRYIVVLEDEVAGPRIVAEEQVKRNDGDLGLVYRTAIKGYSAELSTQAVKSLRRNPKVAYVVPDRRVELTAQSIPTGLSRTYAPQQEDLDIDETDDVRIDADVAIVDTGIDQTHPDLNVVGRINCVPPSEDIYIDGALEACVENSGTDGYGHGTHVAGTVGALDNGIGVVGVAPGVRLWSLRVFTNEGASSQSWMIAAVDWVTAHANQIEVANLSLGCWCPMPAFEDAIGESVDAGVAYAVAAGNEGRYTREFSPAKSPDVLTVSALADSDGQPGGSGPASCYNDAWGQAQSLKDDELASFSNFGPEVDVVAPGVCIKSTVPIGGSLISKSTTAEYAQVSGTSMAAPHVAGAEALYASQDNPNSRADVEEIYDEIRGEGNFAWVDRHFDGVQEPLLDLRDPQPEATTMPGKAAAPGVVLKGVVNPGGEGVSYRFDYGPTSSYGSSTSLKGLEGSFNTEVSHTVSAGEPRQPLHYRVVVVTGSGTLYGEDRTISRSRWWNQSIPSNEGAGAAGAGLYGVDCSTPTHCLAVGQQRRDGKKSLYEFSGFAVQWSGGKWSGVTAPPVPSGAEGDFLASVSCDSPTFCMAAGYTQQLATGLRTAHAVIWNGSSWGLVTPQIPSGAATSELRGVSCASDHWCVAVGIYRTTPLGAPISLVEIWDGEDWELQTVPSFEGKGNATQAVSCASASACMAVGGAAGGDAFGLQWDGTSWSTEPWPSVEGVVSSSGISCTAATACVAVGRTYTNTYHLVTGFWDGTEWSAEVQDDTGELIDVSCVTSDDCDALGIGYTQAIGMHWDGSKWVAENPQQNAGEGSEYNMQGVSCAATEECVGVGGFYGPEPDFLVSPVAQRMRPAPRVETGGASGLSLTRATVHGTVNPGGTATTYYFEYGPTVSYGTKIPISPAAVGSGTSVVPVEQALTGLAPSTLYHYRLVASSTEGTTRGQDGVLVTDEGRWLQEGKPLTSDASLTFSGMIASSGGISCTGASGSLAMNPAGGGAVSSLSITPGSCTFSGTLKALGCTAVKSASAGSLPWSASVKEAESGLHAEVGSTSIAYQLEGGKNCPAEYKTTGAIVATPDKAGGIGSFALSGTLSSSLGPSVTASGTLAIGPAGKYGMAKADVRWLQEGKPLTSEASLSLSGTIASSGGISCTGASGSLAINPGGSGAVTSLSVTPGSCTFLGTLKALGCTAVKSVNAASNPWPVPLVNDGGSYRAVIAATSIAYQLEGGKNCPAEYKTTGAIVATPDKAGGIGSIALSGTLSSNLGPSVTASGTLSISPAGKYGMG